jgi:FKBP-type peptidyl-prolyl cis-trans isomerase FklB
MLKNCKIGGVIFIALGLAIFAFKPLASQEATDTDQELVRKSSLIIGHNIAKNIVSEDVEIDRAAFLEGIQKGLENAALNLSDEEVEATMTAFQKYTEKKQMEKLKRAAETNRTEGEAFLAKHAAQPGVMKLENGVQYESLQEGAGEKPTSEDTVVVHYHGTFIDGTVFNSSVNRKKPVTFPVNGVVPGFSSALQAMKAGDKWRVVIPSQLAYGMQGQPPIGPNRTLIFEIELLEIKK